MTGRKETHRGRLGSYPSEFVAWCRAMIDADADMLGLLMVVAALLGALHVMAFFIREVGTDPAVRALGL